jgi:hypothetical protein
MLTGMVHIQSLISSPSRTVARKKATPQYGKS